MTARAEQAPCLVCDKEPLFAWTDTHGVAQCSNCGAPYRLLHYENDVRVERAPECLLTDVALIRRCWSETGARLSARLMGMSSPGGYDVAGESERRTVSEWLSANTPAESRS